MSDRVTVEEVSRIFPLGRVVADVSLSVSIGEFLEGG